MTAELVCAATDPAWKIHRNEPDCDCGRCEPAEDIHNPIGMLMSGNPACDYPACITVGAKCSWGDGYCSRTIAHAMMLEADLHDEC